MPMNKGYTPHEQFSLKNHPEFHEKWVQDLIANDPSILGLGDLIMRDSGLRSQESVVKALISMLEQFKEACSIPPTVRVPPKSF